MAISNGVSRIKTFFKEVWTESKKVDWPSRRDTLRYTVIVLGISFALAAFLGILDFLFLKVLGTFIF